MPHSSSPTLKNALFPESLKTYRRILLNLLPVSALSALLISAPAFFIKSHIKPLHITKGQPVDWHQMLTQSAIALGAFLVVSIAVSMMFLCTQYSIENQSKRSLDILQEHFKTILKKLPSLLLATVIYAYLIAFGAFLVVPTIFLAIIFIMYTPAILFDHYTAFKALKYSWKLVWGNWWRTFLFILIFIFVSFTITAFLTNMLLKDASASQSWGIYWIVSTLTTPWIYIALTLMYRNYKMEKGLLRTKQTKKALK